MSIGCSLDDFLILILQLLIMVEVILAMPASNPLVLRKVDQPED